MGHDRKFYAPKDRIARKPFSIVDSMATVSVAAEKLQANKFPRIAAPELIELRRFHVAIGLHPEYLPDTNNILRLVPSRHAVLGAQREQERKGVTVHLPTVLDFSQVALIEQGIYQNALERILIRIRHDAQWDLVLSILMTGQKNAKWIITAWINSRTDRHHTLDRTLYENPASKRR
jgi:hypothetical protein